MARKVKCAITGEYGTSDTFVKIGRRYYKSQEVYDRAEKEKQSRQEVMDMIAKDFLGYKDGQVFPTILPKKMKELEYYGYDVINRTIKDNYNSIVWAINNKHFENDVCRIAYIMAIIKNNINDTYRKVVAEEKAIEKANNIIVEVDNFDIGNVQQNRTSKNIAKWLEE